ncbi:MAG: hypothetical protein Kow00108_01050 [Calditrichia bacterium]
MFNPDTLEYYTEYIEFYNNSNRYVSFSDIVLKIGDNVEEFVPIHSLQPDSIPPQSFGLILDRGYVENNLNIYSLDSSKVYLFMTEDNAFGSTGLPNSREECIQIYLKNSLMDSIIYSPDLTEGYSLEKVNLHINFDAENWHESLTFRGTPGQENSSGQKETDLQLDSLWVRDNRAYFLLKNVGFRDYADSIQLELGIKMSGDRLPLKYDWSDYIYINPGRSTVVDIPLYDKFAGNFHVTGLILNSDDFNYNNSMESTFSVPLFPELIVMNELMISSSDWGEWIEIKNNSDYYISLDGLYLMDAVDTLRLPYLTIDPEGYFVFTEKSPICQLFLSQNIAAAKLPGWLTLNNSNDILKIFYNDDSTVIDELYYNFEDRKIELKDNVSLEKIRPEWKGTDIWNWGNCIQPSGHTAGRPNSLFIKPNPQKHTIIISPNPFSPDNDGHEDVCNINLNVNFSVMNCRIKIFTLDGHLVYEQRLENIPGQYQLIWEGKDSNYQTLPAGLYIVLTEVLDIYSGQTQKIKKILVLAKR